MDAKVHNFLFLLFEFEKKSAYVIVCVRISALKPEYKHKLFIITLLNRITNCITYFFLGINIFYF